MTCITTDTSACPRVGAHWLAVVLLLLVMGLPALTAPREDSVRQDWHGNVARLHP